MTVTTDEKLNSATIYQVAYENNILASVTIELVTKCNWRCSHCYIPSHTNRGMSKEKLFSLFERISMSFLISKLSKVGHKRENIHS